MSERSKARKRKRWPWLAAAFVVLAAGATGAFALLGRDPDRRGPFADAVQPSELVFEGEVRTPSWSADERVAFTSVLASGSAVELVGCNTDTRLSDPDVWAGDPAWSPDGRSIVFVVRNSELWLAQTPDEEPTSFYLSSTTPLLTAEHAGLPLPLRTPSWSPDGSRIAFGAGHELWSTDPHGSDLRRLIAQRDDMLHLTSPTWSPDGTRLAFAATNQDHGVGIYATPRLGDQPVLLTPDNDGIDTDPDWSPTGGSIAFVSDRAGDGLDLYVMGEDGSGVRRLTDVRFADGPDWSSNGSDIVFAAADGLRVVAAGPESGAELVRLEEWECPQSTAEPTVAGNGEPAADPLAEARATLDFPPSRAPEWINTTFWGAATWTEVVPGGALVTWHNQPFTLSIRTYSPVYDAPVDRPYACGTSDWSEPDPLDAAMEYLESVEQAALGGSFKGVLNAAVSEGVTFPTVRPSSCLLSIPDGLVLDGSIWDFSVPEYAFGDTANLVVNEDRIDAAAGTGMCDAGSTVHLERVGWMGDSGGAIIQGTWTEWPDCRRAEHAIDGTMCESVIVSVNLRFTSDVAAEHDAWLAEQRGYIDEIVAEGYSDEIVTLCNFSTRGRFYAFSLPRRTSDGLPAGLSPADIETVLTATSIARNGAMQQLGMSDEEVEAGFIETVAELRKEALTWIVRNMPIYDASSDSWTSFESFAIDLGVASGVPAGSRLATDPVGTAADLAFGNASTDDMVQWLGLGG